ncbi:MAG: glycoside hydrolase family 92 protein, partial [Bacteroidales bacterium]|nr:glycoside hydrolase family 92 protein [Bacteroidales bacterium]
MKYFVLGLCMLFIAGCTVDMPLKNYTQYVDPFIGTQNEGHCFPGATVPLGMVQVSPESYNTHYTGYEMDHVTGYQYNDPWIIGFTQTHLNGVGCPSMSDILLLPYCNNTIDHTSRFNSKSTYKKASEMAMPGYYSVYLDEHHVKAELTATEHGAYHLYTFDHKESAKLLIDLQYGVSWDINGIPDNILSATQQFEDDYTLTGYRKASVWTHRDLFYVIRFNKAIKRKESLEAPGSNEEKAPRYLLSFDMEDDQQLEVIIGLSTVGI